MYNKPIWEDVPELLENKIHGFQCVIRQVAKHGHLCGYVGIPSDHPLYGVSYDAIYDTFSVHGGITFDGEIDGYDGYWFFGFDCTHCDDYNPLLGDANMCGPENYRDHIYVMKEVQSLADQLNEYRMRHGA